MRQKDRVMNSLDASDVAHRLTDRPTQSGNEWRAPCPAHDGEDNNLAITNSNDVDRRLLLFCHSHGCTYKDIIAALRERGIITGDFVRPWTYPANGNDFAKTVTRHDYSPEKAKQVGKSKDFRSPGKQAGTPLLIRGDDGEGSTPVVIVEGEAKADDLLRTLPEIGVPVCAVATYPHGAKSAGKADYTAVRDRVVYIWPDPDDAGEEAAHIVRERSICAGAKSIYRLPEGTPAPDDLTPAQIKDAMREWREWTDEEEDSEYAEWFDSMMSYAQLEAKPIEWLWEPFVARGELAILASAPKSGKSWLALTLAAKLAERRQTLLGCDLAPKSGTTWYFSEDSDNVLAQRRESFGTLPDEVQVQTNREYTGMKLVEAIAWGVDHRPRPDLIVIDTVSHWSAVADLNDNSSQGSVPWLRELAEIAKYSGCAILVCHHNRKAHGDRSEQVLGATTQIAAAATSIRLDVQTADGERTYKLSVPDTRLTDTVKPVNFEIADGVVRYVSEPAAKSSRAEKSEAIMEALEEEGPMTRNEIAELLDCTPAYAGQLLKDLQDKGDAEVDMSSKPYVYERGKERNSPKGKIVSFPHQRQGKESE